MSSPPWTTVARVPVAARVDRHHCPGRSAGVPPVRGASPVRAAARARGRSGGRRSKLGVDQRRTARTLYDERALTVAQIGQVLGVSRTSIYRALGQDTAAASGAAGPRTESTA